MMQHDDIHATARGNQVVARNVIPIVLPLLKR
jgi:acyl-CoA thioesterase-1